MRELEIGKGVVRRRGTDIALLNFGARLPEAMEAGDALDCTVVDMRWVKPLDTALLADLIKEYPLLVTLEDNAVAGGAGSAVSEWLATQDSKTEILHLGIPDSFIEHGSPQQQHSWIGLDGEGIRHAIEQRRSGAAAGDIPASPQSA
jgi:1-deoxy-D-xylulose-5-phosphate synthase